MAKIEDWNHATKSRDTDETIGQPFCCASFSGWFFSQVALRSIILVPRV